MFVDGQVLTRFRNKLDNRIVNLRCVTAKENSRNCSKRKDSTSMYFGVTKYKEKFSLQFQGLYIMRNTEKLCAVGYNILCERFDPGNKRINEFIEDGPSMDELEMKEFKTNIISVFELKKSNAG